MNVTQFEGNFHVPVATNPRPVKRVILAGKGASGKDHMRKVMENSGFVYGVSYTTRPARAGEVEGKDYYFKTVEEFDAMIKNDEFYEYVDFNSWYYGTTNLQFQTNTLFVMTPHGISNIKPEDKKESLIVYFDITEDVRKTRLMERQDADKADRRIAADNADFASFKDYDLRIVDPNYSPTELTKMILAEHPEVFVKQAA